MIVLKHIIVSFFIISFTSCSVIRKVNFSFAELSSIIDTISVLNSGFSGIMIYDLDKSKILMAKNAEKYFMSASNTKLFTFYSCLKTLGDSLPALRYVQTDSTFTFWGTADPTLKHPFFKDSGVIDFLKEKANHKKMFLSHGHIKLSHYGPGWMWDDFNDYYQAEHTSFPLYGNMLYIKKDSFHTSVTPSELCKDVEKSNLNTIVKRDQKSNHFVFPSLLDTVENFDQQIPYYNAEAMNIKLLQALINDTIYLTNDTIPNYALTKYSLPKDSVLRRMMQISDNMLAEHLLLSAGSKLTDSISLSFSLQTIIGKYFNDLPQKPIWVDGSGLSRYNRFTPASIIHLLKKMHKEFSEEQLFSFLVKDYGINKKQSDLNYEDRPIIFAKSGSMTSVYNLSGYMITSKGKKLAFSFLNNNFFSSITSVRKTVEHILMDIGKNN